MGSEPNWKIFLPPSTPSGKSILSDLEPDGWKDILTRARKGDKYNSQIRITRDTPVFSVDYPSAYAYAKWKKRRLPSSDEWLRAASGNDMRPYPWGTDSQAPGINLGIRIQKNTPLESYSHMLPAESNPADIGPFQHFDLGGNLSEWIASPNPLTPSFIGGNFEDTFPVSNLKATRTAPTPAGYPFIGFRTAR
jgi:formylglycine-generating enzyme required for sulfatase activity